MLKSSRILSGSVSSAELVERTETLIQSLKTTVENIGQIICDPENKNTKSPYIDDVKAGIYKATVALTNHKSYLSRLPQ